MPKQAPPMTGLEAAILLATEQHAGQQYGKPPGKLEPYIFHPLRVMLKVNSGPEQIVAVLHDVIEDTEYPLDRIYHDYPAFIGDALDAISHRKGEDYWRYIDRCKANEIARAVKIADVFENLSRLDNLPDPEERAKLRTRYQQAIRLLST